MQSTLLDGLLPGIEVVRQDFPILGRTVADGQPLVYLDSANTSQKPQVVVDTMVDHLEHHNANVARAMHTLGAESPRRSSGPATSSRTSCTRPTAARWCSPRTPPRR